MVPRQFGFFAWPSMPDGHQSLFPPSPDTNYPTTYLHDDLLAVRTRLPVLGCHLMPMAQGLGPTDDVKSATSTKE